jgi:dTDP-4-amino-4,6-dideoxygalactose transaminase
VFSVSLFPVLWASSLVGAHPDVYLWEKVRPLLPLPEPYTERFPNVQAAIGLEALKRLDGWTADVQANAAFMNEALGTIPGVAVPRVPPDRTHVYYQYCVYGPSVEARDALVGACVRRGVDIETLHVDVPPDMTLFEGARAEAEGARITTRAIQVPIYAGLTRPQVERVAATVRGVLGHARHPSGSGRATVERPSG